LPALTLQVLDTEDFVHAAGFLYWGCTLVVKAQNVVRAASDNPVDGKVLLRAFEAVLTAGKALVRELEELKEEAELFLWSVTCLVSLVGWGERRTFRRSN
jgi:hypothetical protein